MPSSRGTEFAGHVTCPLHNWNIGFEDGKALAPDEGCARRFDVRIEAGEVFLQI